MCLSCTNLEHVDPITADRYSGGTYNTYYAFAFCPKLSSMDMVQSLVEKTPVNYAYQFYHAFHGCAGLSGCGITHVKFGSATNTWQAAYYGCKSITSAYLSVDSNVTNLTASYFDSLYYSCTNLSVADIYGIYDIDTNKTKLFNSTFNGCSNLKLINFHGLSSYYSNGWGDSWLNGVTLSDTMVFPDLEVTFSAKASGTGNPFADFPSHGVTKFYFPKLNNIINTYG